YNITSHFSAQFGPKASGLPSGFIALEFVESPAGKGADGHALGEQYLAMLGTLVADAWSEFSPSTSTLSPRKSIRSSATMRVDEDGKASVDYHLEKTGRTEL